MIGPGEGIGGGISALIGVFLTPLRARVSLSYLATVHRRALKESGKISLRNLVAAGSQYLRFLARMAVFRPHIVHVHTSDGIAWLKDTMFVLAGRALRCRVVLHMHGGNFFKHHDENPRAVRRYTERLLRLADGVISVSRDGEMRLRQMLGNRRVVTLLNCVDLEEVAQHGSRGDTAGPVHALFVGRVGPSKGAFDLINALGLVQARGCATHTWIAGEEEREGDLPAARASVGRMGLANACEVLGNVDRKRKNQLLAESGIFLLPSYYECLPMALLEAMAAGLPVVATAVGGIPELVRDGENGFLISPGDVAALAERIETLTQNPELRASMGRKSRAIAKELLDREKYVAALVDLYNLILAG